MFEYRVPESPNTAQGPLPLVNLTAPLLSFRQKQMVALAALMRKIVFPMGARCAAWFYHGRAANTLPKRQNRPRLGTGSGAKAAPFLGPESGPKNGPAPSAVRMN